MTHTHCDKCGKEIKGTALTNNYGEGDYDFCSTCYAGMNDYIEAMIIHNFKEWVSVKINPE